MPAAEKKVWTSEDVRRLRDEQEQRPFERKLRYEVVDGELVVTPAPSPDHQAAVMWLGERLTAYVRPRRLGWVVVVAADVGLDDVTNVQPDVVVMPLVGGRRPRSWDGIDTPLIAVEVLSPSTARYDRWKKRLRYQRAGIAEYWIVDLDARLVERWRPADERPEIVLARLSWHPAGATEPLEIDLPALFAEAWDEEPGAEPTGE